MNNKTLEIKGQTISSEQVETMGIKYQAAVSKIVEYTAGTENERNN